MQTDTHRSFVLTSPEETDRLARALAPGLAAGDVILLQGGLGAGKTHFARAVIQERLAAAGLAEDVPSPTFTLVQSYDDGIAEIWHSDLYRLSSVDEVFELGLLDAFDNAICLVEWPDRLGTDKPPRALTLQFAMTDILGVRTCVAQSTDPRWNALLDLYVPDPVNG